jgi:hypothetical protein
MAFIQLDETKEIRNAISDAVGGVALDALSTGDLLILKSQVEQRLPARSLKEMNLEEELVEQYLTVKALQEKVLSGEGVSPSQLAQVANQVVGTLSRLVKMQIDLERDEQMKKIEEALLEAVQTLPEKTREAFFNDYERIAAKHGVTTQ